MGRTTKQIEDEVRTRRTATDRTVLDIAIEEYRKNPKPGVTVTPEGNLHVKIPQKPKMKWDFLHDCWVERKPSHGSWDLRGI